MKKNFLIVIFALLSNFLLGAMQTKTKNTQEQKMHLDLYEDWLIFIDPIMKQSEAIRNEIVIKSCQKLSAEEKLSSSRSIHQKLYRLIATIDELSNQAYIHSNTKKNLKLLMKELEKTAALYNKI